MSRTRFDERKKDVQATVARLSEAVALPVTDLVRDATIQRFEFTFETVWKTLKLHLENQGHECPSPRATLKRAFSEGLIPTDAEADVWLRMIEDRNLTSHAYDEALAARIHHAIVAEYAALLVAMGKRIEGLVWE